MATPQILVIDDDDDVRAIAQMSLEAVGGFSVRTASCGEDGVVAASEEPPDAILLDVMMPGMDGPTTFRRLQAIETTRDVPVVLLTAKVMGTDGQQFADLGVAGVISKPFDAMQLPTELSRILGWSG